MGRDHAGDDLFEVYRSTTPGGEDYAQPPLATTGVGVTTYLDAAVSRGTTYYYTELAVAAGPPVLKSPPSNLHNSCC